MSRITQLLQAKYKTSVFLVRVESVDQFGQKRIEHNYPNTQAIYAEPQGKAPPKFTMDIFFQGENYKDNYNAFKAAVEDPRPGRLYLPTFGVFENMVAFPGRAESTHTEIGEIKVNVTFSVTVERPSPTISMATEQSVSTTANTSRLQIAEAF